MTNLSFKPFAIKEKGNYLFVNLTNDYTLFWFSCLHDLILFRLLFEPASDCGKTNKGLGCVEKMVEAKLSIQY